MLFLGELSALLAAILWSFSSFLFTSITNSIGSLLLNIYRMVLAALFLIITILIFGFSTSITINQFIYLSLSGFVGLVIGDTFLFKAFKEIGARITMLIMSINPAIAAIIAYFSLGESLSFIAIIGMIITLSGIFIVVNENNDGNSPKIINISKSGIIYAFLAAAGQGIGLIFAKLAFVEGPIDSIFATFIRIFTAIIFIIPITIIMKRWKNPVKIFSHNYKLIGLVIIGSIIGPYLGIFLSFIAVINTKVGIASTIMSSSPILMLPLAHYIYKEHLSLKSILGAIVAVLGIAILFLI